MSYVKIKYVEKYNNPCLRSLFVLMASSIYLYCTIPIARVSLDYGSWAFQLSISKPLQILIVAGPMILWMFLYPAIVTLIIMTGEWFLSLPIVIKTIKFIARKIRRVYQIIVDWNNSW